MHLLKKGRFSSDTSQARSSSYGKDVFFQDIVGEGAVEIFAASTVVS